MLEWEGKGRPLPLKQRPHFLMCEMDASRAPSTVLFLNLFEIQVEEDRD